MLVTTLLSSRLLLKKPKIKIYKTIILFVGETGVCHPAEEHGGNNLLKREFGLKRQEVTGG
jgi:hypothetical protein